MQNIRIINDLNFSPARRFASRLFSRPSKLALFLAAAGASFLAQGQLITDGGFESPVVGPGGLNSGFQAFTTGQSFGGAWTVIGPSGANVAVVPHDQTGPGGVTYQPAEGLQHLDLSGATDNGIAVGVQQSFSTLSSQRYQLSFYLGDLNNPGYSLSGAASVIVKLNGSVFQTVNNNGPSGLTINWVQEVFEFTATGSTTTIGFINNAAYGVGENGIDAVSVVPVPEPASGFLCLSGVILLAVRALRRTRN